jgi:hypothetical protein
MSAAGDLLAQFLTGQLAKVGSRVNTAAQVPQENLCVTTARAATSNVSCCTDAGQFN